MITPYFLIQNKCKIFRDKLLQPPYCGCFISLRENVILNKYGYLPKMVPLKQGRRVVLVYWV